MRKFWIDCVLATALVFLSMWGLFGITQLQVFNAFDPIGQALGDVELTDYVFSSLRKDPDVDQNIVIVNIGNLSRRQIAEQIQIISKYKPKVIGIDGFFDCSKRLRDTVNCPQLKDTFGNLMLSNAIQEAGNVDPCYQSSSGGYAFASRYVRFSETIRFIFCHACHS